MNVVGGTNSLLIGKLTEPVEEVASLVLATNIDVRHVHLNGTPIDGASRHATIETQVNIIKVILIISIGF